MTSVSVEYKSRLKELFKKYNKSKIGTIDRLVAKYQGNEHELYVKVCQKYGVNPQGEYNGPADGDEEPEEESDDPFASTEEEEEEEKVVQEVVKPKVVAQRKPVAKPKPAVVAKPKPAVAARPKKTVAARRFDTKANKRQNRTFAQKARPRPLKKPVVQEDEKAESPDLAEEEEDEKTEKKAEQKVSYPPPNAWVLLFRQTSTEKGGGPWQKHLDLLNPEELTNPLYANFQLLEGDYFRNRNGAFRFKLAWPSAPEKITPSEMEFLQTSHPFAEEIEGFAPVSGELEDFEGLWRPEDCASLCQAGACGLKIGLDQEHSDGVSQRGMMAPGGDLAYVCEMYVAVPAIARYTLADTRDLEGENDGELCGGAKFKLGALNLNADGFFKVPNCAMFKAHKMKKNFTVSVWVQQLKIQECAHIIGKGPWRKAFSIGIRYYKGQGNQTRFSVNGSQGQKVVNATTKGWDLFPQLSDPELQKLALEDEDKTWYHFCITLGDSWFRAYVNGKLVGEQKFHGNSILKGGDLKVGAGGSGSVAEYPLRGRMFDLLLFDRALAPTSIQNVYECGAKKAADLDRREIQAIKDAEEEAARKRAQPSDQYQKMMARMKMRKR